jgi:hypothetical protein
MRDSVVGARPGSQQADRNHKTAAFAADDFEVGQVFPAARAERLQGIAALEFGDVWGEILGL